MIKIDGESLTPNEVYKVSVLKELAELSSDCYEKIDESFDTVKKIVDSGKIVYGINTGFGKLSEEIISKENIRALQKNLLLSHASGTGKPFSKEEVKSIILVRANSLAKGYSGVRRIVIEKLLEILNKDIYPYVPSYGSLGASGDLAPLAHIALLLIGKGKAFYEGSLVDFEKLLDYYRFAPLDELFPKEGLALINGTAAETGIASLILSEIKYLFEVSLKSASLSIEALRGKSEPFIPEISNLRNFREGLEVSEKILNNISQSSLVDSEKRVQDAYVIRCIPQVYGSLLRVIKFIEENIIRELNAVTDNPIILSNKGISVSGGNFHAEMVAFSMDFLSIAMTDVGNMIERRINRILNSSLSGLPSFLAVDPGLNSGMMILQYTAAALTSMNKALSHPSSVDSIPVSADQEDHVSMGMNSILKAKEILENLRRIISIELLVSIQGIDFLGKEKLGNKDKETYLNLRNIVDFASVDREFSYDLEKVNEIIKNRLL